MAGIKVNFLGFLIGTKDSLLGALTLFYIDKDGSSLPQSKEESEGTDGRPPSRRGPRPQRPARREKAKVVPMMMQCCLLNGGVFLLSIIAFESYLVPTMKYLAEFFYVIVNGHESWLQHAAEFSSNALEGFAFLFVVFAAAEIADAAYRRKLGRPIATVLASRSEGVLKNLSKSVADVLFSIHVEVLFLIQARLVGLVPVIGPVLAFIHMTLLYSLYAFEYTWVNLGWGVVKRISYVENHWPYFVGFGLLLTVFTSISSSTVVGGCLFGVLFPLFILSALEAKPVEDCEFPLRLFSGVIWLTNRLFIRSRTSKSTGKDSISSKEMSKQS